MLRKEYSFSEDKGTLYAWYKGQAWPMQCPIKDNGIRVCGIRCPYFEIECNLGVSTVNLNCMAKTFVLEDQC